MFLSSSKCSQYESDFKNNLHCSTAQISKTHLKNSHCISPCEHTVLVLFWLNCAGLLQLTFYLFQSLYVRWIMSCQLSLTEISAGACLQLGAVQVRPQSQVVFSVCIQCKYHTDTHPREKCGLWHVPIWQSQFFSQERGK